MTKRFNQQEAIQEIQSFFQRHYPTGTDFSEAAHEISQKFPLEPFPKSNIENLVVGGPGSTRTKYVVFIFALAGHSEILPFAQKFFSESETLTMKLEFAAAMAQLGDESGYQFIEDVFQRYVKQDEDMKNFDFEDFVYIFEEVLINERGQEMIARFRKEADYDVVWETLETPDV